MAPYSKHITKFPALLFVLLLSCAISQAQDPTTSSPEEQSDVVRTGTISGKVVNESGQPLSDALVSIRAFGSTTIARNTTTNRDGSFQFTGLPRVVYLLSALLSSYTPVPRDPDSTQSTSYRIGDNVTLVLIKGGVITGKVTSPAGEPLVGIRVRAQMIRDGYGQRMRYGSSLRERTTDDRGIYRIYGLPAGTYLVMAGGGISFGGSTGYREDAPVYSPSSVRDNAAQINVQAGQETTDVDIRYRSEPGHTVSGFATGPQAPDIAFSITLTSTLDTGSRWNENVYQSPASQGFSFYGVADGDYDVTAQSFFPNGDRTISVPKRIKVRGADVTGLELVTQPLASISGRVVLQDSNAAECKGKRRALITETLVSAWHNENDSARDQPPFIWAIGGPAYPNEAGEVTLRNLAAGQYQILTRLFAKYWYLRSITLPASTASAPESGPSSKAIDAVSNWATLRQGVRLSGLVVTLSEGAASLQGQVLLSNGQTLPSRLYVYLVPVEREKAQDVLRFFAAPVSADKKITVNHIQPGRYWIVAQPALEGAMPTLTKLRLPDEKETRARLRRDAETEKVEIEFKPCQNVADYRLPLNTSPNRSSAANQ